MIPTASTVRMIKTNSTSNSIVNYRAEHCDQIKKHHVTNSYE